MPTNYIYCCDWGTTSLRTRLVDLRTFDILHQTTFNGGIASVFENWIKEKTALPVGDRTTFYLSHLSSCLKVLAQQAGVRQTGIPVVLSGMASSSLGIIELPYAKVPYSLSGSDAIVHALKASSTFNHPVFILSGVRDGSEVMRGEETPLCGLQELITKWPAEDHLMALLPGTHSKHVFIKKGMITSIATHVTGELFDVLTANGLLKHAVERKHTPIDHHDWKVFLNGVQHSGESPLLRSLFRIRTNELLGELSRTDNYFFLSGLLIGYELRSILNVREGQIALCSGENLFDHYQKALAYLGLGDITHLLAPHEVERATVRGQIVTVKRYLNFQP